MIRATVTLMHLAAALLAHLAPLLNERRASTPCFKITTAAICAKIRLNRREHVNLKILNSTAAQP